MWFVQKRKVAEFSLRAARDELRAKVRERTNQLRIESAEREKAEQTVHRTQAQLAHVNRVMTMGELATSIAHELNQPLMAVAVNGDACLQWLNGPNPNLEEARAAVARMAAESGRAGEIIKRIRALSQNSSPRKERVDLHAVIEETLALTNGELVANRVAVETDLATDLPGVWGDRVQLQQVILNLIINAIQAMNESNESARRLHISTGLHGTNAVVIGIRDFGPGIGAIRRTTSSSLSRRRRRASAWGSRSAARSSRRMPAAYGERGGQAGRDFPFHPSDGRTGVTPEDDAVVFVVDDDVGVRDAIGSLLRSIGLRMQAFTSTSEFLGSLPRHTAGCLVLDVRLPGTSGLELQRQLRASGEHIPVIFITGHGDIPMSVEAMKAGAVEFLTKPVRGQELLTAVQKAIRQDRDPDSPGRRWTTCGPVWRTCRHGSARSWPW